MVQRSNRLYLSSCIHTQHQIHVKPWAAWTCCRVIKGGFRRFDSYFWLFPYSQGVALHAWFGRSFRAHALPDASPKGSVSAFEFKQGSSVVSQMCKPLHISNEFKKNISGLKYWDVISLPNRFYLAGVKVETWSWQHKSILQVSRLLHLDVLLSTANSLMVLRDGSSPAVVARESVLKLQNLYKVHVCVWLCVC